MPWVVPLLHPSAIIRGRWPERAAQRAFICRAVRLIQGGSEPMVGIDVETPPPGSIRRPDLSDLAWFDKQIDQFDTLSIDIENAGHFITLIGITLLNAVDPEPGPSLSLPFRTRHGLDYWTTAAEHRRAVTYLYYWLADPDTTKLFHNGITHDVPLLEETGFEIAGPIEDTMVTAHYCYPEMRRGLQYVSTLYLGMPLWKTLLDEKDEDEGKG